MVFKSLFSKLVIRSITILNSLETRRIWISSHSLVLLIIIIGCGSWCVSLYIYRVSNWRDILSLVYNSGLWSLSSWGIIFKYLCLWESGLWCRWRTSLVCFELLVLILHLLLLLLLCLKHSLECVGRIVPGSIWHCMLSNGFIFNNWRDDTLSSQSFDNIISCCYLGHWFFLIYYH